MQRVVPDEILARRDKMGFVTPEELWLKQTATSWFRSAVDVAVEAAPNLLRADRVAQMMDSMIADSIPFTFEPWRILCLGRWLTGAATSWARPATTLVGAGASC